MQKRCCASLTPHEARRKRRRLGRRASPANTTTPCRPLLQIIWGDGFLSPGGAAEVARLLEGSDIVGCTVLDIGCGLGAIDELLVAKYAAASVVGIDIDPSLLAAMRDRVERARLADRIRAVQVTGGPLPFAEGDFDVVFSKDSTGADPGQAGDLRRGCCGCCAPGGDSLPVIGCGGGTRAVLRGDAGILPPRRHRLQHGDSR